MGLFCRISIVTIGLSRTVLAVHALVTDIRPTDRWNCTMHQSNESYKLTVAGMPSPAAAHFLRHCCRVSIPFCSTPFAMLAPRVTWPVGASTTPEHCHDSLVRHDSKITACILVAEWLIL